MTKIKICGLFRPEDIAYANQVCPDFAGFILTPGYRRSITIQQAMYFRQRLNDKIKAVGVFVNASVRDVAACLKEDIIQTAQLHGEETEAQIRSIQDSAGKPVWKAVKVRDRRDVEFWLNSGADSLLFDSGRGCGRRFDWELLAGISRDYILAGGLHAGNLEEALALNPYAVDLSTGVETEGVKDLCKMQQAVTLVREKR